MRGVTKFGGSRGTTGGAEGHDREGTDLNKPPHCLPEARLRVNNVTVTLRLARGVYTLAVLRKTALLAVVAQPAHKGVDRPIQLPTSCFLVRGSLTGRRCPVELKEFVRLPSYLLGNGLTTAIVRGLGYSRKIARKNQARLLAWVFLWALGRIASCRIRFL